LQHYVLSTLESWWSSPVGHCTGQCLLYWANHWCPISVIGPAINYWSPSEWRISTVWWVLGEAGGSPGSSPVILGLADLYFCFILREIPLTRAWLSGGSSDGRGLRGQCGPAQQIVII
jgi:hypothetical protein